MTLERFPFQRQCVIDALLSDTGIVLNVGCDSDPGYLRGIDPERVVNCDIRNPDVDLMFDCARDRWPCDDGAAALVVFGDILEHLDPEDIGRSLREARRVSRRVCITVPEDRRPEVGGPEVLAGPRGAYHLTTVTRALLEPLLDWAGWKVTEWRGVLYDDGAGWGRLTMGHFVSAVAA